MGSIIKNKTPDDLKITARDVHFDYLEAMKTNRYWHSNDPVITHFFNALQATFPEGERFFIDATRDTRDQMDQSKLPDPLKEDIKQFIRQEALHGREHETWCNALNELGYTKIADYGQEQKELREWAQKKFDPLARLASTVALEHFTATIASVILYKRPDLVENAAEPFRSALLYHTLEEVEHKSVCYDLFLRAGGNYGMRMFGLFASIISIIYQVRRRNVYLLEKDGLWNRENQRKARKFIWGRSGLIAALLPKIIDYLRPSFHPWDTDERAAYVAKFGHYLKNAGVPT